MAAGRNLNLLAVTVIPLAVVEIVQSAEESPLTVEIFLVTEELLVGSGKLPHLAAKWEKGSSHVIVEQDNRTLKSKE